MIEAYKKFFINYTNFSGRSTRSDYWYAYLDNLLIVFGTAFICSILGIIEVFLVFYTIYSLATFIPSIALFIRRMHDINMSGWWYFIGLVPLIGLIILLIFLCTDSVNENNKYGKSVNNIDNNVQDKEIKIKASEKTLTKNINDSLCTSCGKRIDCNDSFCKHCGKKVKKVIKYCRFCGNELNANFECEKCAKKYENDDGNADFTVVIFVFLMIGLILLIFELNS